MRLRDTELRTKAKPRALLTIAHHRALGPYSTKPGCLPLSIPVLTCVSLSPSHQVPVTPSHTPSPQGLTLVAGIS